MDCASDRRDMNAMSELKTLDERIDFLETKLTFLDNTIETLNTTITEQWLKIDGLSRQLASLNARLQEAEARPPGPANEPPPHY
jgi:SlyX protein